MKDQHQKPHNMSNDDRQRTSRRNFLKTLGATAADPEAHAASVEFLQTKVMAPLARWLGPPDGEGRAARLRPVVLEAEALWVRTGLRWSVRIPRERIVAVHHPDLDEKLAEQALAVFYQLRGFSRLRKRPSTSELVVKKI